MFVFQIYAKKKSRLFTVPHENFINEEVKIKDPETLEEFFFQSKSIVQTMTKKTT